MKRLVYVFCAAAILALVSCTSQDPKDAQALTAKNGSGKTGLQIPNPRVDYDKPDFSAKAGFAVKVYPNYKLENSVLIADRIGELNFSLDAANKLQFRVAVDTGSGEDISGVYETFKQNETLKIGNTDVKVGINENSLARALWAKDGYVFSLYMNNGDKRFSGILSAFVKDVVMEPARAVKK